mmetsp:Transcript_47860/g.113729  ORF Transcript_47860/g.113729 Transcript_47860/m.113729 type:complete len:256 (-) Transcript_47860:712-1479(-)
MPTASPAPTPPRTLLAALNPCPALAMNAVRPNLAPRATAAPIRALCAPIAIALAPPANAFLALYKDRGPVTDSAASCIVSLNSASIASKPRVSHMSSSTTFEKRLPLLESPATSRAVAPIPTAALPTPKAMPTGGAAAAIRVPKDATANPAATVLDEFTVYHCLLSRFCKSSRVLCVRRLTSSKAPAEALSRPSAMDTVAATWSSLCMLANTFVANSLSAERSVEGIGRGVCCGPPGQCSQSCRGASTLWRFHAL